MNVKNVWQGFLRVCGKAVNYVENGVCKVRMAGVSAFAFLSANFAFGQDTSAGVGAMENVTNDIAQYIEPVRMLIYAIAAIVAIGGGISVYVKMNNEEQDVKKSIMMIVGACIFLIAAATALPAFFGYN